jgi:L-ribulose-5-phosphate 3-epimerase
MAARAAQRLEGGQWAGRLGLYINLQDNPEKMLALADQLTLHTVEIYNENLSPTMAGRLITAIQRNKINAVSLFSMGPGEMVWDFVRGPQTLGLVPRRFRNERVAHLKRASDFAKQCGIHALETHCGFIPEDPADPLYRETVAAIREVAGYCRANGQKFLYHAGQETAITLLRIIQDVGLDNQRVGLDTANPVMYGKGNPVDTVDVLGSHLGLINAKDGLFPTDPKELGKEVPIGRGKVDFRRLFEQLKRVKYPGPVLIEREIDGPGFAAEIETSAGYLSTLMGSTGLE